MPDICHQDLDRETFGLMDQHIPLDCIGVFGVLIFLSMFAGLFLSAPVGGCCHCGVPVEVKV